MKTILVTGGAGFIGSCFIKLILTSTNKFKIVNVDKLTYAGNINNVASISKHTNYHFIKADIRDKKKMEEVFFEYDISIVVNFAAESHVDRSITDAEEFLKTNIIGTHILLETAKLHWKIKPLDKTCRTYKDGVKFIQISTDEVYGSLGKKGLFSEISPIQPNSPYSSSKASADLLVKSFYETYKLPFIITRCSNNFGENQHLEKFIPTIIKNAYLNQSIPLYGDGLQSRDWIYVKDHCRAIKEIMINGKIGEVYNIGASNEQYNIDIVALILEKMNKPISLIKHVTDRFGHDRRYAVDNSKITKELNWQPSSDFSQSMDKTIDYYINEFQKENQRCKE